MGCIVACGAAVIEQQDRHTADVHGFAGIEVILMACPVVTSPVVTDDTTFVTVVGVVSICRMPAGFLTVPDRTALLPAPSSMVAHSS